MAPCQRWIFAIVWRASSMLLKIFEVYFVVEKLQPRSCQCRYELPKYVNRDDSTVGLYPLPPSPPLRSSFPLEKVDPDDVEIRRSKFHFVDLAGSERAKRTGASGQRFKEV